MGVQHGESTTDQPAGGCSSRPAGSTTALPVLDGGSARAIGRSKMGPRRAAVLIAVHVVMVGHAIHYMAAGRTLSPIEPSESMYALELGQVNAGFIFFAAALLATLVFGRFVCGWGCHLVAYQDLCGWIMKKLNVRPRPFRTRILIFVPLGLALYMFVYPTVKRLVFPPARAAFPGFSNHVMTMDFWKTFPGPVFAILTVLVCGFAVVYVLGSKGFCTYACPYGGFFGLFDKLAVGKILVSDACEQCGHCTATCTSNVRVHEEVKLYGMVVDPGCMKCLDCVSVCPTNALRFGFGRPSVTRRRPETPLRPRRYDFTLAEEIAVAVVFMGSMLALRGLYDGPPLLMSVCLAAMSAYLALKLYRVVRDPTVRIQNLRIKTAGLLGRSGWVFAILTSLWFVFIAHSGFVQWHRAWGRHYLSKTEVPEEDLFSGKVNTTEYSAEHEDRATRAFRALSIADRWGLVGTVDVKRGLAWLELLNGEQAAAEEHIRGAIAVARDPDPLWADLAKILALQGRWEEAGAVECVDAKLGLSWFCKLWNRPALSERFVREAIAREPELVLLYEELANVTAAQGKWAAAIDATKQVLRLREPSAVDHFRLAGLLVSGNRAEEAVEQYRACIRLEPEGTEAHYNLGGLLGRIGRFGEAIEELLRADELVPDDPDTQLELGLAHGSAGRIAEGIRYFERAMELDPDNPEPRMHRDYLIQTLQRQSPGEHQPDGRRPR